VYYASDYEDYKLMFEYNKTIGNHSKKCRFISNCRKRKKPVLQTIKPAPIVGDTHKIEIEKLQIFTISKCLLCSGGCQISFQLVFNLLI
jgi:hypothetical protein